MKSEKPHSIMPLRLEDHSDLTPDMSLFHALPLNAVILTKFGRYVYLKHGNENKCGSFFATLSTIINKL